MAACSCSTNPITHLAATKPRVSARMKTTRGFLLQLPQCRFEQRPDLLIAGRSGRLALAAVPRGTAATATEHRLQVRREPGAAVATGYHQKRTYGFWRDFELGGKRKDTGATGPGPGESRRAPLTVLCALAVKGEG
jgi:hypothetical protein